MNPESESESPLDPGRGVRRVLVFVALLFGYSWCCAGCIWEPAFETADTLNPRGHDVAADAMRVAALGFVVVLIAHGRRWPRARLALAYGLLIFVATYQFRDAETAASRRFACLALLSVLAGVQIAARSGDSFLVWKRTVVWAGVTVAAAYAATRAGYEYLGLEPTWRVACGEPPPNENPFAARTIPSPSGILARDKPTNAAGLHTRGGAGGKVVIERVSNRTPVAVLESSHVRDSVLALALAPGGRTLAAAHSRHERPGSEVSIWDLTAGERSSRFDLPWRHTFHVPYAVDELAFLRNGTLLVAVGGHWRARIWDVESGEDRGRFAPFGEEREWAFPVQAFAVAPDGNTFATVGWGEGWVWRARPLGHVRQLAIRKKAPAGIGFSVDGRYLIVNDTNSESWWPLDPSPLPFAALVVVAVVVLLLGFYTSGRMVDRGTNGSRT
jgi:hypothetical protein